jgi:outer membrane biosynthesis protein TonB
VYRDYKRDGIIAACDHTRKDLRRTLKTIRPQFEDEFPDFRDAVRAAIKQHNRDKCTQPTPTPTSTPAPTTPAPSTPPPPPATPAPAPVVPAPIPTPSRTAKPPKTSPTPEATVPPAPTPTPTPPPTAAQQEAQAVVSRPGNQSSLLVPGILLAIVLLGSAAAGGSALLGSRSPRFAAMGQAWREAAFRAGGTWGNFTDWLRLGR